MTTTTDPTPYVTALTAAGLPAWLRWRVEMRPNRRTFGATTERGGVVVFAIPPGADPEWVVTFIQSKLGTLRRHVRDREESAPTRPIKELVRGEGFRLLGTNHRLELVDDSDTGRRCPCQCSRPVTAYPGLPIVAEPAHPTGSGCRTWQLTLRRDAASAATIAGWYQEQGQGWVDRTWPRMASRLRIADGLTVRVRSYRPGQNAATWGTYRSGSHSISLHWALFQLGEDLVESVLGHELAHATRPGGAAHGPAWRAVYSRLMPDWRERKRRLGIEEKSLWFGDVRGGLS